MGNICRQILVFLLVAAMLFSAVPVPVFAAGQSTGGQTKQPSSEESISGNVHANEKEDAPVGREKTQLERNQVTATGSVLNNMEKAAEEAEKTEAEASEKTSQAEADKPDSDKENNTSDTSEKKEETGDSSQSDTGQIGDNTEESTSTREEVKKESDADKASGTLPSEDKTEDALPDKQTNPEKEGEKPENDEEEVRHFLETEELQGESAQLYSTLGPHDTPIPGATRHYFTLQKNSKKVSETSGAKVKVVSGEKAGYQYIADNYGDACNFTPRFTNATKVKVGGGSGGGISFDKVKASEYSVYGDLFTSVQNGRIQTRVYDLEKCTTNPYALYSKVGTWYDPVTRRVYDVDMKVTVTGYLFPGKNVRSQLHNTKLKAPFIGFHNSQIGLVVMGTDYVETKMDFFYSGTETPVSGIKGAIQFADIDAQQGVDFGSGFSKVLLFKGSGSHLQYHSKGVMSGSVGYVSSRTVENLSVPDKKLTTAVGIFSGPSVKCRWTVAKCDHKDTGGSGTTANYYAPGGYGIPADSSQADAVSYYYSNSTGFIYVAAQVGILPLPQEVKKAVYTGTLSSSRSQSQEKIARLADRAEKFTFVVSAAAASGSPFLASYSSFVFSDSISEYLKIRNIKIYADKPVSSPSQESVYSNVTSWFHITRVVQTDKKTKVTAAATQEAREKSGFYGRMYYLHIEVELKSDAELSLIGKRIEDIFQTDNTIGKKVPGTGDYTGRFALDNQASLSVANSTGNKVSLVSNEVSAAVSMRIAVKKQDRDSGEPVKGVVFGLFGGRETENNGNEEPLYKAVTDENGIAVFDSGSNQTFYKEKYKEGPYYIKEISVPEQYKNVWNQTAMKKWSFQITSLKSASMLLNKNFSLKDISAEAILVNDNNIQNENALRVYKKSKDTGAYLKGAVFQLYEWSAKKNTYVKKMSLEEKEDASGRTVYTNPEKIINTMDNLGKYKIVEAKAPKGCVLTGEEWAFEIFADTPADGSNLCFTSMTTGKMQTGSLVYSNPLQKGILTIVKRDDKGELVPGASFSVTAKEDIYAPWDVDEKGSPLENAEPLMSKGTLADIIKTGENGIGSSTSGSGLYIGEYIVKETGGAEDHIKTEEEYTVTLQYNEDETLAFVSAQIEVSNCKMHPALAVAKIADRTRDSSGGKVGFSEQTGRYLEEKVAGIYHAEEIIHYTITVTNTGNVELFDLHLTEDMNAVSALCKHSLAYYMDMETASFVLPENGLFETAKGRRIHGKLAEETNLEMTFDHLDIGDSVSVDFTVRAREDAANAYNLENSVLASAYYKKNQEGEDGSLSPVPTAHLIDSDGNSLVVDKDHIHIPGEPGSNLVKQADRTTGIKILRGEIVSGLKIPGIYREGEEIEFRLTVKNTGTANLHHITVTDEMSQELKDIIAEGSAAFRLNKENEKETIVLTADGKQVSARCKEDEVVELCYSDGEEDKLLPGDYVELSFYAQICRDAANLYDLENTARINAWYFNGTEDVPTDEKIDTDKIEIPGTPETEVAKLANRTTGVTLEDGRYLGTKVTGTYENGEKAVYTITVTNIGKTVLYDLRLEDVMSEKLKSALVKESIHFETGEYKTTQGHQVRTWEENSTCLGMDVLLPGDSVDIRLTAKVREDVGNLFELQNTVNLTAKFRQGNEEEKKLFDENEEKDSKKYLLQYDSNLPAAETDQEKTDRVKDSETPCSSGTSVRINGNCFVREGYYFCGWNTRADGSGEWMHPDEIYSMPDRDVILYAGWKKKETAPPSEKLPYYKLFYDSNNDLHQKEADEENSMPEGYHVTINQNSFIYPGWEFCGWNTRKDGSGKTYMPGSSYSMPAKDVTLYARWKKIPVYSVVYHANNQTSVSCEDARTPCNKATVIRLSGNPYEYIQNGKIYSFVEWNTHPDGSGESYHPGDTFTVLSDTHFYAQWKLSTEKEEKEKYPLIYRANNGTASKDIDEESPKAEKEPLTINSNPFYYAGYNFIGWNTKSDGTGKAYSPGDILEQPSRTMIMYAQWEKAKQGTLIYHSNTKAPLTAKDAQTVENTSGVITIDGNPFENKGHLFVGWNTKADGTGDTCSPGDFYTLNTGESHLYAQWTDQIEEFVLSYHSNYPDGTLEEYETDSETPCCGGTSVKINRNYFWAEGWHFTGWNTAQNGEGKQYLPSQKLQMPSETVILYAQWEKEDEENESKPDSGAEETKPEDENRPEEVEPSLPSAEEIVKENIQNIYQALRKQTLEETICNTESYIAVPVTEKMTDSDHINILGTPSVKVAKMADKTTGAVMKNGRYTGRKIPGTYGYQEQVDYKITVTNSGTADIYNLIVTDKMEQRLFDVIEKDSVRFMPGRYRTQKGKTVNAVTYASSTEKNALQLDSLSAGDKVILHLTARVKTGVKAAKGLQNTVTVKAEYQSGNDSYAEVPQTPEMTDNDKINIGTARLAVAKLAGPMTIDSLKNGRYSGKKKQPSFNRGQEVSFTVIVSNLGTGTARNVIIRDNLDEKSRQRLNIIGFSLSKGDILESEKGEKVNIIKASEREVILEELLPQDAVLLKFTAKIKKDATAGTHLTNTVKITGQNRDFTPIPETEEMQDQAQIKVNVPTSKKATLPAKTGDTHQIREILALLILCLATINLLYYLSKRKKDH